MALSLASWHFGFRAASLVLSHISPSILRIFTLRESTGSIPSTLNIAIKHSSELLRIRFTAWNLEKFQLNKTPKTRFNALKSPLYSPPSALHILTLSKSSWFTNPVSLVPTNSVFNHHISPPHSLLNMYSHTFPHHSSLSFRKSIPALLTEYTYRAKRASLTLMPISILQS